MTSIAKPKQRSRYWQRTAYINLVTYGSWRFMCWSLLMLGLATQTPAQVYEFDPDAELLGKPQQEYVGDFMNWLLASRQLSHTTSERLYENQQGPVFFLATDISPSNNNRTRETAVREDVIDVPQGAPIAAFYWTRFVWDHVSNCADARNGYDPGSQHYLFINDEAADIDPRRNIYEAEFRMVNREATENVPIGTRDACAVMNMVLVEPPEPGLHTIELGERNNAWHYTINVFEPELQVLGVGEVYSQDFNSLGTDGETVKQSLPAAWTVTDEWGFALQRDTDADFPINSRPRPGAFPYVTNAGVPGEEDRSLSIYMPRDTESRSLESDVSQIQFLASANGNADSLQLQFDIEAWDVSSRAADSGEAAFDVTVELDSGNGFEPFLDLGEVTTGELQKPEGEYLNGNDPANRVSFDSGILQAAIPDGSQLRFRWAASLDGNSDGWVFGLDDVQLSLFGDSGSIFGDFDESGAFGPADIDLLSAAARDGIDDLAFDTNGDGRVGPEDYDSLLDQANVLLGDSDMNSAVDFSDFLSLSKSFGQAGGWREGDFDGSGDVDFPDFLILSENFGTSSVAVAAVPEPSSACLFGLGVLGLNARRRKRAERKFQKLI